MCRKFDLLCHWAETGVGAPPPPSPTHRTKKEKKSISPSSSRGDEKAAPGTDGNDLIRIGNKAAAVAVSAVNQLTLRRILFINRHLALLLGASEANVRAHTPRVAASAPVNAPYGRWSNYFS